MKKFVVVAGNIGVGKSTLVEMLCLELGWEPFYEPEAENPYLSDFYEDMNTWSFHSQVFFLARRLQAHHQLVEHPSSVIQDRSVYEDAEVFACNLHRQGHMSDRDYRTYTDLYRSLAAFLPPPDLIVYLRATVPTLLERIRRRGREYERQISAGYLGQINALYRDWIAGFTACPILTVPADDLDYVAHSGHFRLIARKVQEKLMGKEEVVFDIDEVNGARFSD